MKGTIKWYDRVKGYGFIFRLKITGYFYPPFRFRRFHTQLEAGQAVEFEV